MNSSFIGRTLAFALILLSAFTVDVCVAQSNSVISNRIYTNVSPSMSCARLLDINGQFGCSSKEGGNSGMLYLVDSDAALQDVPSHAVIVLDPNYFNGTIVNRLVAKAAGFVVLTDTKQSYRYSPDIPVPNAKYGLYPEPKFTFNPNGDSLSYQSFDNTPFFVLDKNTSLAARSYALWNREGNHPQYGCHMESFMHAYGNAEICLRRSFCSPIGGQSTWATFSPEVSPDADIILVSIPIDATAFFHDLASGGQSTAYGQAVLIGVLEALSANKSTASSWNSQVIFAAYDGERWGYLGSTKFSTDLFGATCTEYASNGACNKPVYFSDPSFMNITFSKIKYIVELNQIGNPLTTDSDGHFLYALNSLKSNNNNAGQKQLYQTFSDVSSLLSKQLKVSTKPVDQDAVPEIPPSSSMAFLKINPNIPTIVVTDHFGEYTNKYYLSHNDDGTNVNHKIIGDSIVYFATLIDRLAGGNNTFEGSSSFALEILDCLTRNYTCDLMLQFSFPSSSTPSSYTSVYGGSPNYVYQTPNAVFMHTLMAYFTASYRSGNTCGSSNPCEDDNQACVGGACVITNAHYHDATSPAFGFDSKAYVWTIVNSSYPTYVESNWNTFIINFYLQDSHTTEALFLVFGIIEMFVVIAIIFVSKRYLSKRYKLL